jgi:FkbM family methyltransferase
VLLDPRVNTPQFRYQFQHDGQPHDEALLQIAAAELGRCSAGVFIDVGAHIGMFSLLAQRFPGVQVHAFEPVAATHDILRAHVALNGLEKQVRVVRAALSDQCTSPSEQEIRIPTGTATPEGWVSHHGLVTLGDRPLRFNEYTTERVALETLDNYCAAQGIGRVDFIKIDTEGWETRVLAGASAILRRDHPALLLEYNGTNAEQCGSSTPALLQLLAEHGYTTAHIVGNQREDILVTADPLVPTQTPSTDAVVVQIGANNGGGAHSEKGGDHVHCLVDRLRPARTVLVEPLTLHGPALAARYAGIAGVEVHHVAICPGDAESTSASELTLFASPEHAPDYQVASTDRQHVLKHERPGSGLGGVPESSLVTVTVPCTTLAAFFEKHGLFRVDLLFIDIEGLDLQVLQSLDLGRWDVRALQIEHLHLHRPTLQAHMTAAGYAEVQSLGQIPGVPDPYDSLFVKRVLPSGEPNPLLA